MLYHPCSGVLLLVWLVSMVYLMLVLETLKSLHSRRLALVMLSCGLDHYERGKTSFLKLFLSLVDSEALLDSFSC